MSQKTKNIVTWVLSGLLAFAFLGSGITKLLGVEMQIKNFESWGFPLWTRFPIGLTELAFTVGLLVPSLRKMTIFGIFCWAVVAVYTHIQSTPPQYEMIGGPLMFFVFALVLFFVSRNNSK